MSWFTNVLTLMCFSWASLSIISNAAWSILKDLITDLLACRDIAFDMTEPLVKCLRFSRANYLAG
jgi:hypothetical protein